MQALRFILFILGASGAWQLYQMSQATLAEDIDAGNYGSLLAFAVVAVLVGLCFWGASAIGDHLEANGTTTISLSSGGW